MWNRMPVFCSVVVSHFIHQAGLSISIMSNAKIFSPE